ncbi:hypothetical protein PRJ39_13510 [Lysobacter enzymogenes]|uniref:hypothetical protein n=1 Tax=Lysobacter enzymogenes TaxID=69 RepID=UPI003747DC12
MSAQAMFEFRVTSSHAQPHRGSASAGSRRAGRTCQNCQEPPQPRRLGGHTDPQLVGAVIAGVFDAAANRAVQDRARVAGSAQARAHASMPSPRAPSLQASNFVRRHSSGFLRACACAAASLPVSALDPS